MFCGALRFLDLIAGDIVIIVVFYEFELEF